MRKSAPASSYWHAILHRREPDYWNSKYWFRKVGQHPVFADLAREAGKAIGDNTIPSEAEFLLGQKGWDPLAFVDLCEKAAKGRDFLKNLCRDVQHREWQLLFDYCFRKAVA